MAATHFEILKLPNPIYVVSLMGLNSLQENTLYNITDQSMLNFKRVSELENSAVFENLEYRTYDNVNDVYSNKATIKLKWRSLNVSLPPSSGDITIQANKGDVVNLLDVLPLNETVEYIDVKSIYGVKNLKVNNQYFYEGVIAVQDLKNAFFTVKNNGGEPNYAIIKYQVGKEFSNAAVTVYDLVISIDTIAELTNPEPEQIDNYSDEFDVNGVPTNYNVIEQKNDIIISEGFVNGLASVEFTINSPFLLLNSWNSVVIIIDGVEHEFFQNGSYTISVPLDSFGSARINTINKIVEDSGSSKTGSLTIKLDHINGDPSVVSQVNDEVIISTNF